MPSLLMQDYVFMGHTWREFYRVRKEKDVNTTRLEQIHGVNSIINSYMQRTSHSYLGK